MISVISESDSTREIVLEFAVLAVCCVDVEMLEDPGQPVVRKS